jgi:hypothetical protein
MKANIFTAITLSAFSVACALAIPQQSAIAASKCSTKTERNLPTPDLIITSKTYRQYARTGIHLYPGEIIQFRKLNAIAWLTNKSWDDQALQAIDYDLGLFRAGPMGATGRVVIESGPILPFYLLWSLSELARMHDLDVTIDQPPPATKESTSERP